jgi:hypothetical protein
VDCLIAAIHEANANGEENTITLAAGTYTLTAVDNTTDGPNGLPSITSALTLEGAGADTTILARAATAPPFGLVYVAASGNLTLARITLRGGGCSPPFFDSCHFSGGGIFNDAGTVTLTQSTVAENRIHGDAGGFFKNAGTVTLTQSTVTGNVNRGEEGGALFNYAGTLTLVQSTVADNSGFRAGGLVSIGGTVTLTQSTVVGNRGSPSSGVGGIIQRGGTLRITQSRIIGNSGSSGGLVSIGGTVTLTQSTVADNSGRGEGGRGGIVVGSGGVFLLVDSTVVGNGAACGGGITNSGQLHITNSTVAHNSVAYDDCGILENFGTTVLLNTTIAANGGIALGIADGTVTLQNTILARNDTDCGFLYSSSSGSVTSLGNNLIGDPARCPITLQGTDRTGDPGLDAFIGYFPLLETSQAIDAGNDAACPPTDQLGQPRVGQHCDIGAIEFQPRDTTPPTGKLLIDLSHKAGLDVSGFTDFLQSQGWTIDEVTTGPITESVLHPYDIFMILGVNESFSPAEISAVNAYVRNGGGLWIFHEFQRDASQVNAVSNQFGVTFNNDEPRDPTNNEGEDFWPTIHLLQSHEITEGVSSYGYYAGASLNVRSPATIIATGDNDTSSEAYSSFPPVLAAATIGNGRVVFSGDQTPLHPSYYGIRLRDEERLLLSNIVEWLVATVEINALVTFEPVPSTFQFTPDPTGCPEGFVGTFSFEARLTNASDSSLTALVVEVITLTNGNLLLNADGGPAGVGAQVTVPPQDGFADAVLSPEEFVDVPFRLCLQEQSPFSFFVDVFGEVH